MKLKPGRWLGVAALAVALGASTQPGWSADYLTNAKKALEKGDLRTAQIELRNAVRSDPQNADARFLLARVQLELGDAAAAEQQAREAQARGYDKFQTTGLIGQAMLVQGHIKELLNELQPKGDDPRVDSEIMVDRGAAQVSLGEIDEAQKSFGQAQKLDPKNIQTWLAGARLAIARGDRDAALSQLEHALTLDAKSVDARVMKAQLLLQARDIDGALKLVDAVISDSPPAIPARVLRSNIMIAQGKFEQAKADDDAVLGLQGGNVEALYIKAVLLHEAKDDQGADALLQKLEPVFDRMPRAFYLQALVKQALGQQELAASSAEKYVSHVPSDLNGVKLLAQLDEARGRPDLAAAALRTATTGGRADLQVWEMLAKASLEIGDRSRALDALHRALSLAPAANAAARAQIGAMMLDAGQPDEAATALESALAADPKQPQIAEAWFLASLKTGDLNRTAEALKKIHDFQGDTPQTGNLDGLMKMARLDLPGARAAFETILRDNPDFVPARINLARLLGMQGDMPAEEKVLSEMLDKAADAQPALGMMADLLLRSGRVDQAVALMERAHQAAPKNLLLTQQLGDLYVRTGKPQKALDLVAPANSNSPVDTQLLGVQAAAQLVLKQADQARSTLTRIVNEQPRNIAARRQLVALLVDANDLEGARNLIKAGMSAMPDAYQLKLDYALVDLKSGGLKAAVETAKAIQDQNRADPAARALIGDLYMAADQPAEAANAYKMAATETPSQLLVLRQAGALQRADKRSEAEKTLGDWIGGHPTDLAAAAALSELQIAEGKFAAAKVTLQGILAKAPRDPGALNNLAWVDQKLGDQAAKDLAQQAYLLAPTPQTADTLGWILTTSGNFQEGAPLLRQASAGSTDPRITYHLAVALKDSGDKAQAVNLLKAVTATQGDFEEKTAAEHLLSEMTKGS